MMRRVAVAVGAVVAVAMAVSGCGSSGAGTSPAPTNPASAGDATTAATSGNGSGTLRLGLVVAKDFTTQSYYTAQQKGYFKDNGVTVKVTAFHAGADAVKALVAGNINVIVGTGFDSPAATAKGVPLKVFAGIAQKSSLVLVAGKNSGITSMTDIKGKKLGLTAFGSLTDYVTRFEAQHAGLNPKTGIKQVALGGLPAQAAALASGAIDAFNAPPAIAFGVVDKGAGKIVGAFSDINPDTQFTVLESSPKYLQSHKELVTNFLKSYYKGINYFKQNKNWGVKATKDSLGLPSQKLAQRVYNKLASHLSSDGTVDTKALRAYAKAEKNLGIIKTVPKLNEFYTDEFLPVKTG